MAISHVTHHLFTHTILLHLPRSFSREVRPSPFDTGESWGLERLSDLPKSTQLIYSHPYTQNQPPDLFCLLFHHSATDGLAVTLSQRSSRVAPLTFLGLIILCCGHHPVHCKMFSSIPGFKPPDASSISCPSCNTKTVSRRCQMSGGWPCHLQRRTAILYLPIVWHSLNVVYLRPGVVLHVWARNSSLHAEKSRNIARSDTRGRPLAMVMKNRKDICCYDF